MIEVMNFFQAMFVFKNFAPAVTGRKEEVKLAIDLKAEAQNLALIADEEVKNAKTAQMLAAKASDENRARVFTEIAVWHNGRAAAKYRKSAERFEEAGKVYTKKSKAFNAKAEEMMRRSADAEIAVSYLNEFFTQN